MRPLRNDRSHTLKTYYSSNHIFWIIWERRHVLLVLRQTREPLRDTLDSRRVCRNTTTNLLGQKGFQWTIYSLRAKSCRHILLRRRKAATNTKERASLTTRLHLCNFHNKLCAEYLLTQFLIRERTGRCAALGLKFSKLTLGRPTDRNNPEFTLGNYNVTHAPCSDFLFGLSE